MDKIDINEYSSKIKSVFIQLYNYSYFHSPTDLNECDERFIGRKEILVKLKSILIDSETKSGVYLVTGHRGMGKSSLVSKAINDIHLDFKYKYYLGRILRIFFLTIIIYLIHTLINAHNDYLFYKNILFIIECFAFLLISFFLFCISKLSILLRKNDKYYIPNNFVSFIEKFTVKIHEVFQIKFNNIPSNRGHILLNDFLTSLIINFSFLFYLYRFDLNLNLSIGIFGILYNLFWIYLLSYYIVSNYFPILYQKFKYIINSKNNFIFYLKKVTFKKILKLIIKIAQFFIFKINKVILYLSLSNRIYIKINLGYNDLTPIEVFKLISKSLRRKFLSHYRSFKLLNISTKIFYMICIYFITGSFYYQKSIYEYNYMIKKNLNLTKLFPSQEPIFLESSFHIYRTTFEKVNNQNNDAMLSLDSLKSLLDRENKLLKKFDYNYYSGCLTILMNNIAQINNNFISFISYNNDTLINNYVLINPTSVLQDKFNKLRINEIVSYGKLLNNSKYHNFTVQQVSNLLSNMEFSFVDTSYLNVFWSHNNFYNNNNIIIDSITYYIKVFLQLQNNSITSLPTSNIFIKNIPDSVLKINSIYEDRSIIRDLCNYIDFFISQSYYQLFHVIFFYLTQNLIPINFIYSIPNDLFQLRMDSNFKIIPVQIDYLFIFYLVLMWYMARIILTKSFLFKPFNRHSIINKLNFLVDLIDSQITISNSSEISAKEFLKMKIFKSSTRSYPKADVREIETYLIEVLEEIERIPAIIRPEFVFIFDELDKIEPNKGIVNMEVENEIQRKIKNEQISSMTPEGIRQHQQAIFDLLSSMKYFLTTAKSKFLFIAGRELYDAYLADIAGNKNSIDSIFHDRINLNSFYSDTTDMNFSDITSMTEQYVCKYLFPIYYKVNDYSLKSYNQFLIKEYDEFFNENHKKNNCEELKILARQKREKIIITLKQFITYLTHVSNGSPKKITSYFEKYIVKFDSVFEKEQILNDNLHVGYNQNNYFLKFDSPKQYILGMYYFLLNPIIQSINNRVKEYDDKLLISSSYIINHLFKFHRDGFSWRNLELAPEIIDINRTPELRSFIKNIINFLSQTHIREIVSGLFTFKFTKKISFEIAYLSKISEDASAAFNFTLDESLPVKKQHEKLLLELIAKNNISNQINKNEYIHSISAVQMILGDLKFYDEDFTNAILDYMDSIQNLRYSKKSLSESKMILFIRIMLKLGFAFEKRNTYTSAYVTYGELSSIVVKYRDINLEDFGLSEYRKIKNTKKINDDKIIARSKSDKIDENYKKEMNPLFLDGSTENNINETSFEIHQFFEKMRDNFTPLKENLFFKITSFEGIRLMYQPLIAKFQMIEKSNLGGITLEDVFRLEAEFNYLTKAIKKEEKYLILSEFWNKAGDILYYKNGFAQIYNNNESQDNKTLDYFNINIDGNDCITCRSKVINSLSYNIKVPCLACYIYHKSLDNFIDNYTLISNDKTQSSTLVMEYIFDLIITINDNKLKNDQDYSIKALASILSDIGNVYLNCSIEKEISENNFSTFLEFISCENNNKNDLIVQLKGNSLNQFEKSFLYFYGSAILFKKANEFKDYAFQLSKIIYTLREYLLVGNKKNKDTRKYLIKKYLLQKDMQGLKIIENYIVKKAIKSIYAAYDNIHRFEINNLKKTFWNDDINMYNQNISLNKISINTDLDEINFTYLDLIMKCGITSPVNIFKQNVLSPYSNESNIYNRIIKLKFKAYQNFALFKELIPIEKIKLENNNNKWNFYIWSFLFLTLFDCNKKCFFDDIGNDKKEEIVHDFEHILQLFNIEYKNQDFNTILKLIKKHFNITKIMVLKGKLNLEISNLKLLSFLITDSIFCLSEIIRLSNVYGVSYVLNYSYLGFVHYRLLQWRQYYKYLEQFLWFFKNYNEIKNDSDLCISYFKNESSSKGIEDDMRKFTQFINKYHLRSDNENSVDIKENLLKLVGDENLSFISENYLSEKTVSCFYSAIETHSEGSVYKKFISKMFYLNDDFNDDLFHFSAATERYRILNSDFIREKDKLKKQNSLSGLYNFDNYFQTEINPEIIE